MSTAPDNEEVVHRAWHDLRVVVLQGVHDTDPAGGTYRSEPLLRVLEMKPTEVEKVRAWALIPSSYAERDARVHDVQKERGQFVCIVADIDGGCESLESAAAAIELMVGDAVAVKVYTTASSAPGAIRCRAIIPLAAAVGFPVWSEMQNALVHHLRAVGLDADSCAARPGQLSFLPNKVPGSDHFDSLRFDGEGLDPQGNELMRAALAQYRGHLQAVEAAKRQAVEAANRRRQSRPTDGASVIEAFNAANSVAVMLSRCGYKQRGDSDHWRSPHQTSATYATRDFGDYWISLSWSDAAAGVGRESGGGMRCGDAFDLECHYHHRGNVRAAVRAIGDEMGISRPRAATATAKPRAGGGDLGGSNDDIATGGHEPESAGYEPARADYDDSPEALAEARDRWEHGGRDAQRAAMRAEAAGEYEEQPVAELMTPEQMLERFAFVAERSMVVRRDRPEVQLALADFRNWTIASTYTTEEGKQRQCHVKWFTSPKRITVDTVAFEPGRGTVVAAPDGVRRALNMWKGFDATVRSTAPGDPSLFVDHVEWLSDARAGDFLDWLAHIEQSPGTLPHVACPTGQFA